MAEDRPDQPSPGGDAGPTSGPTTFNFGGDDTPSARNVVGQLLFDPATGQPIGVLVENDSGELFIRLGLPGVNAAGTGSTSTIRFQPGPYMLANGQVVAVGNNGTYVGSAITPSTGGTGGIGLAGQIQLLEKQAALAQQLGDHEREADLRNQIEVLKLNQGFATSEREGSQEFQAGENVLSRENQVRLQRLGDLSSLQQQILADRARGQNILVEMIGNDPIRAGAIAQGGVPRRGTPADIFRGELTRQVNQPLVQPASLSLEDIGSAITETQGNLGLPSPGSLGFNQPIPSAAHGATIDMKQHKDGKFRILVGDAGPELLEGNRDGIQITPIATAAHGAKFSFSENPFTTFGGGAPGFRSGPRTAPRVGRPHIQRAAPGTSPASRPGAYQNFPEPDLAGIRTPNALGNILAPNPAVPSATPLGATIPPRIPSAGPFPPARPIQDIELAQPGGELSQGFNSIFDFLGFDQVPTFTEGQFGGMQVPSGGLGALNTLGIDPSLLRILGSPGTATNFFRTPSGELQRLDEGQGNAGLLSQTLGLIRNTGAGFNMEDFLTIDPGDLAAQGIGSRELTNAPAFEGQGLFDSRNPFPTPRFPLAVPPGDAGGAGFFLPDPRTLASLWPRLPESVKQNLLSAYGVAGQGQSSVFDTLDFFTPRGGFQGVSGLR